MEIVCRQWTEGFEIYGYHSEDLLNHVKEAYAERAKEGISFRTLNYSIEDFLAERSDNDYWFLAFDTVSRILYGTARLTIKDNCGEVCNFAVSPHSQGRHVGAKLLQSINLFAKEKRLGYIISYTAIKAISSVKCHTHNGFRIVGIVIGLKRKYSSYIFRNQIKSSFYWNCPPLIWVRFLGYYSVYMLAKRSNGSNTFLGDCMLQLKKLK